MRHSFQARITDIAKLEGKLDTENSARKQEIANLDGWAKGENDARKTEIANLDNFAKSENDARKSGIQHSQSGRGTRNAKKPLKGFQGCDKNGLNESFKMSPHLICLS